MVDKKNTFKMTLSMNYQESLRYGDSIYLVGNVIGNKSLKLVNSYISSPFHQTVKLNEFSYGENANPLPDLHIAAFRVLYPNYSKAEMALTSYKNPSKNSKIIRESLTELEKEAEDESQNNKNRQKNHTGMKIVYGKVIQLEHLYSGKYLGVSDSDTSLVDRTLLKVTLFETNGEHVQFKITPKYKVHNIGDKIRIEDEIVLENVKCQQYLHFSEMEKKDFLLNIDQNEKDEEINASAEDSTFTLYSHIRLGNESDYLNYIRGGSVIRLYHLQVQSYVVAPGPGWNNGKEVTTDDVHLRARKIVLGGLKPPSTSAITYWQIEKTNSPISGDILKYGEPCRIKHLLTQRYLSIEHTGDQYQMKLISLANDKSGESTQFHFTPFIDKGREKLKDELIKFGYCARIYHPETKTWVKDGKEEFQGKFPDTGQLALRGIKWDDASCNKIILEHSRGYHDAYNLEKVEEHLLYYFHYVIGHIPVIKEYLVTYNEAKTTREMEQSLKSLTKWIQDALNPKDMKNRQKLLRNLGIIELLMEIQRRFVEKTCKEAETKEYAIRKNTTIMIYTVIEAYLKGGSKKNENYTAKYIDSFKYQFGMGVHAEQTLIQLIRDNNTIIRGLSNRFEELTGILFEDLTIYKNPQIFYYFSVMCVTNKSQFQKNQFTLAKRLSESPVENFMFFMEVDKSVQESPKIITISPLIAGEFNYRPLSDYVPIDQSIELPAIDYLRGQLDFLTNLCKGNNRLAIDMLKKKFSFEVLFSGLTDESIHPEIRSKFAQLLSAMYIDVGSNRPILEYLPSTFIFKDCKEYIEDCEPDEKALSGAKNKNYNKIKNWLRCFLEELEINCHVDYFNFNQFIASVLDVLLLFVKFGYYKCLEDINNVLCPLLRILNGFNDKYSPRDSNLNEEQLCDHDFTKELRYRDNEGNSPINDIKKKCLRVFELFMNLQKHRRLQLMLSCYHEFREQFENVGNGRRTIFEYSEPVHDLVHYLHDLHNEDLLIEKKGVTYTLNEHLNIRIIGSTTYTYEDEEGADSFQSILFDLTQYEDRELSVTALRLLNIKYSVENDLFTKALQTQVLTNPSSVELFNQLNEKLPKFRRLLNSSFTNADKRVKLVSILKEHIKACKLAKYPKNAYPQNQVILLNFGLLEDVMNLLEKVQEEYGSFTSHSSTSGMDDITELAKVCCILLQHLAQDNIQIQIRMYNRLEILATEYLFNLAPVELGNLLKQLFTRAKVIVMNIFPKEIQFICSFMKPRKHFSLQNIPPIIEILKAIAKVEEIDHAVYFNQVEIMKNFMQMKPNDIDKFLGTNYGKVDLRKRLLTSNELNDADVTLLNLMLSTFDLMASLCEGENRHHQSVCQSMISVDELLEILNNTDIPYTRKFQFVSFFNWVYLNSHKVSSMDDISVQEHPEFWIFLKKSNASLEEFIMLLTNQSSSDLNEFKQESINEDEVLLKSKLYLTDPISPYHNTNSIDSLGDYLFRGILPIIIVFYTCYFSMMDQAQAASENDHIMISLNICKNLIELAIKYQPFIETKYQATLLYNAPLSIITHGDLRKHVSQQRIWVVDNEKLLEFKRLVDDQENFVPQSVVHYNKMYSEEIMLNDQFRNYAKRMQRAYWGKNTAKVQIGAENKEEYSKFYDAACEYPALDSMPLGPSFQKHLGLFFTHTKTGCKVKKELCISIIKQLKYSYENYYKMDEREKIKQEILDIKSLQLLRGAILNEIKHNDEGVEAKSHKKYNSEMGKIVKIQNDIAEICDTSSTLLILVNHPCETVSFQSIALLIALLYEGNKTIQEKMKCLAGMNEGKFLEKVNGILYHGGSSIKESRSLTIKLDKRRQCFEKARSVLDVLVRDILTTNITECDSQSNNEGVELKSLQITGVYQDKFVGSRTEERLLRTKALTLVGLDLVNKKELDEISKMNRLKRIEVAVNLLGLMCDSHHTFMQNYFRKQEHNLENINIIFRTVNFLKDVHAEITEFNISLVSVVFSTIIELIDGNFLNKMDACDARIIDIITHIFRIPIQGCSIEQEVDLYKSIILFLQVIVEETSMGTKELAKEFYSLIDLNSMHRVIGRLYEIKIGKDCQDLKTRVIAEDYMFRLYNCILHSRDFGTVSESDKARFEEAPDAISGSKASDAWFYCKKNSCSVEIVYENGEKQFILNQVRFKSIYSISEEVRDLVNWKINRQSQEDKLRDFLEWFKAVKKTEVYSKKIRSMPVFNKYIKFQSIRKQLFLFWTFVVNLFLLATWYSPCKTVRTTEVNGIVTFDCNEQVPNSTLTRPLSPQVPFWYNYVFYPIGAIHLILTLDLLILFFIINLKNFYIPDIFHRIRYIKYDSKEKYKFKWEDPKGTKYLKINIFGTKVAFMCIIFLSSLVSLPSRGYLYPICLLYILEMSEILRRVLLAVTKNGKSLIFVAILGCIVLYMFGIIAFALFSQQAQSTIKPDSEAYIFCHTLYECFVTVGRWGLLDTIGQFIPQRTMSFTGELDRIIFDLLFFIVVNTIGLNIIFGIIVDTFSQLRNEKSEQEKDMKNICFICGLENYVFDRKGNGFKNHVKNEHNMWQYYSFFLYLDSVDPCDHTAIEGFVFNKLKEDEIDFFPQNKARCIVDDDNEQDNNVQNILKELQEQVEILRNVNNVKSPQKSK